MGWGQGWLRVGVRVGVRVTVRVRVRVRTRVGVRARARARVRVSGRGRAVVHRAAEPAAGGVRVNEVEVERPEGREHAPELSGPRHLEGVQEGAVDLQEADDYLERLGQRGLQLPEGVHDVAESERLHLLEYEQCLDRGGHLVRVRVRVGVGVRLELETALALG